MKAAFKPGSIELEKHVVNTWTEAVFGIEDVELACKISGGVGIVCGFVSNKLIENIPYDKDDNYNMQFFSFIILLGLLLIFQGVYFS